MISMMYEYLIRSAYGCSRNGVSGANADIFRALERESNNMESYEYSKALCVVKNNLRNAINHVLKNRYPSGEQKEALNQCLLKLKKHEYTKICKTMREAADIINDMGLLV